MTDIVILGAGTAGTIMANKLRRLYHRELADKRMTITIVDQESRHVYQPGLLFVPFGMQAPEEIVKPTAKLVHHDVVYRQAGIDHVDLAANTVYLAKGAPLTYDLLIVASGTRIAPEETEGLTGPGWQERIFDFYTLEGSTRLRDALQAFGGGRLVVNVVEMPIKCPVAPLEFAFLADWYFTERGIRDKVQIVYATPLDAAFTKPTAAGALAHLLRDKRVELVTEFNAGRVDGEAGVLYSWDEREVPFDLLVTIPLHMGAEYVSKSGDLGDDLGFVKTDPHTLQSLAAPNVFAIGDATNVPASKAGSVAHFQSEVLTENVRRFLANEPLLPEFDGHANCFIETGFDKALLIDFNYDVEPLPGTFPLAGVGPMRLLEESRLNHWGKLAFRWIYWNVLLPGRVIPGIPTRMSMRGKRRASMPPSMVAPSPSTSTRAEQHPAGKAK